MEPVGVANLSRHLAVGGTRRAARFARHFGPLAGAKASQVDWEMGIACRKGQRPTLCFMAIIYAALTTLRQTDLKKIIAYSSIGHMNVAIVGLFSFDLISMAGSVILLLGHGIVSPALFISIGVLYDRFKTRLCRYYSGMALSMPLFSTMLFVFTLANLSLPSTVNFVGEFLVFQGTFDQNPFAAAVIATSLVSVGAYALLVCARATFGVPKPAVNRMCDLSRREFFICFPFRLFRRPSSRGDWAPCLALRPAGAKVHGQRPPVGN